MMYSHEEFFEEAQKHHFNLSPGQFNGVNTCDIDEFKLYEYSESLIKSVENKYASILKAALIGLPMEYQNTKTRWRPIRRSEFIVHLTGDRFDISKYRLFEVPTVIINGVKLADHRVTKNSYKVDSKYYIESTTSTAFYDEFKSTGEYIDLNFVNRGIIHTNEASAVAFCKARLGIKD